jgi:hypothetical protein
MYKQPTIKEVKPGVRVREPDTSLKERLGGLKVEQIITEQRLQAAQEVIQEEGKAFSEEGAGKAREVLEAIDKLPAPISMKEAAYIRIYTDTLNLKSVAGLFGFPLASDVLNCLLNYCQSLEVIESRAKRIFILHLQAVYRVFSDKIMDDGGSIGRDLLKAVRQVTALK